MKYVPNEEQLAALRAFKARHGRNWKTTLSAKWSNGTDTAEPNGHLLRQVRNQGGPTWLANFKLEEKEHAS